MGINALTKKAVHFGPGQDKTIQEQLNRNKYDFNILKYPADLPDVSKSAHAIVFYINETVSFGSLELTTFEQNRKDFGEDLIEASGKIPAINPIFAALKVAINAGGEGVLSTVPSFLDKVSTNLNNQNKARRHSQINPTFDPKQTNVDFVISKTSVSSPKKRSSEVIVLGMPDRLPVATYQIGYESYDNSALVQGLVSNFKNNRTGGGLANAFANSVKKGLDPTGTIIMSAALSTMKALAPNIVNAGFGISGVIQNPHTEFLFKAPSPRTFSFEFKFRPRNENEVAKIYDIIKTFKKHMYPETSASGHFLKAPSNFNIHYVYSDEDNNFVNRIATSVLTDVSVDYSPNGFATFSRWNGEKKSAKGENLHGAPMTEVNIVLAFQEISLLDRSDIEEGF